MESAFLSSTPCCCIRSRLFKRDQFIRRAMVVFLVTVVPKRRSRLSEIELTMYSGNEIGLPIVPLDIKGLRIFQ